MQRALAANESEGQRRMAALHGGRTDGLVVAPNLWAGIGLVRGGAGTALVGSHEEVAERIAAAPDSAAYGRLSVLAQWTCRTALLMRLPPAAFAPPPKVWSAVVGFQPHPAQPPPELFAAMERVTAAAFGQRRKMLRGALRPLGGEALLERAGIAPERRAETLEVAEFDRLARLVAAGTA